MEREDLRNIVDSLNAVPQYAKDFVIGVLENRIDLLIVIEAYQKAVDEILRFYKLDNDRLREAIRKAYQVVNEDRVTGGMKRPEASKGTVPHKEVEKTQITNSKEIEIDFARSDIETQDEVPMMIFPSQKEGK